MGRSDLRERGVSKPKETHVPPHAVSTDWAALGGSGVGVAILFRGCCRSVGVRMNQNGGATALGTVLLLRNGRAGRVRGRGNFMRLGSHAEFSGVTSLTDLIDLHMRSRRYGLTNNNGRRGDHACGIQPCSTANPTPLDSLANSVRS
jgi:hypothetical protein